MLEIRGNSGGHFLISLPSCSTPNSKNSGPMAKPKPKHSRIFVAISGMNDWAAPAIKRTLSHWARNTRAKSFLRFSSLFLVLCSVVLGFSRVLRLWVFDF